MKAEKFVSELSEQTRQPGARAEEIDTKTERREREIHIEREKE